MEQITDTIDNGEIENVHLAPIGSFTGSDAKGNPVEETLSYDALTALADGLNATSTEVLADIDHAASKPGVEKDTSAAGWWHKFVVDPIKGLFANLKLTKKGKELIENREYRYVSPTFVLDAEGKPIAMPAASLTNMPAFKGYISPILNTEAVEAKKETELMENEDKDEVEKTEKTEAISEETKTEAVAEAVEQAVEEAAVEKPLSREDVIAIIKETLDSMETAENACSETKEEVKNE